MKQKREKGGEGGSNYHSFSISSKSQFNWWVSSSITFTFLCIFRKLPHKSDSTLMDMNNCIMRWDFGVKSIAAMTWIWSETLHERMLYAPFVGGIVESYTVFDNYSFQSLYLPSGNTISILKTKHANRIPYLHVSKTTKFLAWPHTPFQCLVYYKNYHLP
jgi:hypothetical protein